MKNTIVLFLISFSCSLYAQNFEGTLTYTMDLELSEKAIKMGVTKEMFKKRMLENESWFDTIKTSYKNGFYKQRNLAQNESWLIYRPDSNKIYTFQQGELADLCIITDPAIDKEFELKGKMPTVTLLDKTTKYKNFQLKTVEVKWGMGTYYYLYDENYFHTDPKNFKGHIYDGFAEYLKISKALPVKIIKQSAGMITMTFSLVEYTSTAIINSIFEIPAMEAYEPEDKIDIANFLDGDVMRIK